MWWKQTTKCFIPRRREHIRQILTSIQSAVKPQTCRLEFSWLNDLSVSRESENIPMEILIHLLLHYCQHFRIAEANPILNITDGTHQKAIEYYGPANKCCSEDNLLMM